MAATKESQLKQRAEIEFLNCEGVNQTEIVKKWKNVYKEDSVDQSNVSRWLKRLKDDNSHSNDGILTTRSYAVVNHLKSTEAEDIEELLLSNLHQNKT